MDFILMILAVIGAAAILSALAFVSAVIGGLVNGMITLLAGPAIDGILERRSRRAGR